MRDRASGRRLRHHRHSLDLNYQSTKVLLDYRIGIPKEMWLVIDKSMPAGAAATQQLIERSSNEFSRTT